MSKIIGTSTIEWMDGTPDEGGYYLAKTKDGNIEAAFRRMGGVEPASWKLEDSDCGMRTCDEGYIVAWAQWPTGYGIVLS